MKVITASNGKKSVKMSKQEWLNIGKKAGWADPEYEKSPKGGNYSVRMYETDESGKEKLVETKKVNSTTEAFKKY